MDLFDTHFHYYGAKWSVQECEDYIQQALKATPEMVNVDKLYKMVVGGNFNDSIEAQKYALNAKDCFYAAGVHPHEAEKEVVNTQEFKSILLHPLCKAVGELGLDYFYDNAPKEAQHKRLEEFLNLALEVNLPAIIHCRDAEDRFVAYEDSYDILKNFAQAGGRMVIHCFSGTPEWAEKFLELGSYLGVTGIVTFNKAENIRKTLKVIPLERLLLETDAPYLAPIPFRGKENTPGYLPVIAARVAIEQGLAVAELAKITTENALKFYNIDSTERSL